MNDNTVRKRIAILGASSMRLHTALMVASVQAGYDATVVQPDKIEFDDQLQPIKTAPQHARKQSGIDPTRYAKNRLKLVKTARIVAGKTGQIADIIFPCMKADDRDFVFEVRRQFLGYCREDWASFVRTFDGNSVRSNVVVQRHGYQYKATKFAATKTLTYGHWYDGRKRF